MSMSKSIDRDCRCFDITESVFHFSYMKFNHNFVFDKIVIIPFTNTKGILLYQSNIPISIMEFLPIELLNHFDFDIFGLLVLKNLNKHYNQGIKPTIIKIQKETKLSKINKWIPYLNNIDLSGTKVTDVSALGRVHTLNIAGTKVTDISALGRDHTLNLTFTGVTDVSKLGGVHTLDLTDTKVTDVSMLGGVHTLIFNNDVL